MEFSKEQIEKAKNCATLEEFQTLAKAEGFDLSEEEVKNCFSATRGGELSDEDLSSVAGGKEKWTRRGGVKFDSTCPFCGLHTYFTRIAYYNEQNNKKIEMTPPNCPCGASVRLCNEKTEAIFSKGGEEKYTKAWHFTHIR